MGNLRYEIDDSGRMTWSRDDGWEAEISTKTLLFGSGNVRNDANRTARSIRNDVLENRYADLLAEKIADDYNYYRERADIGHDVRVHLNNALLDAQTLQDNPVAPSFGGGVLGAYANQQALDLRP